MNIAFGDIIIYIGIFITLYITTLWLVVFEENKNKIYKPKLKKNYPNTCIIVPCFNEEKTIIKTVRSLLDLDYPKDKLEILIVDDGSTDKTYQQAEKLLKHKQVKLFHKENGGKWTALNYGIERTNAEFIGCLDADSFVVPDALKIVMAYFNDKNIMAVTSSLKVYQPKNILQQFQKIEYIIMITYRKVFSWLNGLTVIPGPFSIYRKEVFEKLGLFVYGHNTEDCEMALRLQSKNWRIANAPDACVYTTTPTSLKGLQKQRVRWYQGSVRNGWDYKFMFMNKKYEDFGLFILPTIPLAILTFIIMILYALFLFVQSIINRFIAWQAIGFSFNQIVFSPNWFFINTSASFLIGFFVLILIITMFIIANKISNEKIVFKKDFLFFIFLYSPLYLIWWLGALQAIILKKKIRW